MTTKQYRDKLVQQIKDAGQELIDRAESMVSPELDLISDFNINLSFDQGCVPEVSFSTTVINKTAANRYFVKEESANEH